MKLPALAALILFSFKGLSCTFSPLSFCESAKFHSSNLIISGKIVSIDDDGINMAVLEILRGVESRSILRIWDGTDINCNGIFSMASSEIGQVGDTIIISLPKITTIQNSWDVIGDYRRPNPYSYTSELIVKKRKAKGFIIGDIHNQNGFFLTTIEYEKLLKSINEILNCTYTTTATEEFKPQGLFIFENVITSNLSIQVIEPNSIKSINIYSANGHLLETKKVEGNEYIQFDFENKNSGLFIVEFILYNHLPIYKKVIKV